MKTCLCKGNRDAQTRTTYSVPRVVAFRDIVALIIQYGDDDVIVVAILVDKLIKEGP